VPHDPELAEALAAFQRGDIHRARELAERQLNQTPDSPGLQHLLGLIECRSGNIEKGVERLGRAALAEPDNVPFRVMLTRALIDAGRPSDALEAAAPPAGSSPPELALWHTRAEAADAAEAWDVSAEAWERLCFAGVGGWRAWSNYGNALAALQRWPDASNAFKRAAELNPGQPELRRSLAAALARAGQFQQSADELQRWVDAVPDDAGLRITFACLLADLGRSEECRAQLEKAARLAGAEDFDETGAGLLKLALAGRPGEGGAAIRADQVDLQVLRQLARLLERTSRMTALRRLLDDAEAAGIAREQLGYPAAALALRDGQAEQARHLLLAESPDADPVRWHWLMARIEDALGDAGAAFAEAVAMHQSSKDHAQWRNRAANYLEWARDLAELITPQWASRLPRLDAGSSRCPVFLVGFPRSGTTLLDTFLMGHPQATVLEELPLMAAVEAELGDVEGLPGIPALRLADGRHAYFDELSRHVGADFGGIVIDKSPLNMLATPYIHSLFPDAPVIFVQRHPCDAVLSCFMQAFALNNAMACFLDLEDAAALYDAAMQIWTGSLHALQIRAHTIIYEQLIEDPEAQLRLLVKFLGLKWRKEMLDHRATAEARVAIGTPSYVQVTQPLDTRPTGRWKRYEKQLEPVLPILLPWAERLGYRD
jgi:tetratricopeptide (TPR) repeat protein